MSLLQVNLLHFDVEFSDRSKRSFRCAEVQLCENGKMKLIQPNGFFDIVDIRHPKAVYLHFGSQAVVELAWIENKITKVGNVNCQVKIAYWNSHSTSDEPKITTWSIEPT